MDKLNQKKRMDISKVLPHQQITKKNNSLDKGMLTLELNNQSKT